jgi:flagellar protein FlbD
MVAVILLTRLGGPEFALNPDLIERAEETPDTVITLVSGNKYVVRESLADVVNLIRENRAQVVALAETMSGLKTSSSAPAWPQLRPVDDNDIRSSAHSTVVPLHPREA